MGGGHKRKHGTRQQCTRVAHGWQVSRAGAGANALDGGAVLSAPSTVASLLPSVSFLPQAAKWLELPCSSAAAALLLEDELLLLLLLLLRSRKMPIAAATAMVTTVSLSIFEAEHRAELQGFKNL